MTLINFDFICSVWEQLWRDGHKDTVKNCMSPNRATKWLAWCNEYTERDVTFLWTDVALKVPTFFLLDGKEKIIDDELKLYLSEKVWARGIDDYLVRLWLKFLRGRHCVLLHSNIWFIPKTEVKEEVDSWMRHLSQYVRWYLNTNTVKVQKNGKINDVVVGEDIDMDFFFKGTKYPLKYYGMYHMRDLDSSFKGNYKPLPSGNILQQWQYKSMYEFGRENYIFMSRWWGKTVLCIIIALLIAQSVNTTNRRWMSQTILYFIPTDLIAKQIAKNLREAFRNSDNEWFDYTTSNNTWTFYTWKVDSEGNKEKMELAQIVFQTSDKKWWEFRGGRLLAVFFDEWAVIDEILYRSVVAGLDADAMIFVLTTVKVDAPKNRAYTNWVQAEIEQTNYAPMDEVLFWLYNKYWLRDLKKETLSTQEWLNKLQDLRKDFFRQRPKVCLRFTIDDREVESDEDKEMKVKRDEIAFGREFVLAEYYSTLVSSTSLFDTSWIVMQQVDLPARYDHIIIAYDPGGKSEKWDNAGINILGGNNEWLFVLESIGTQVAFSKKLTMIKEKIDNYSLLLSGRSKTPYFVIEVNAADWWTMYSFQKEWITIHFKIRTRWEQKAFNSTNDMSIPLTDLVSNARFLFANKMIKISSDCNSQYGLVDELKNFWLKWWKAKALTGRDDQVMALLFSLYVATVKFWYAKKIVDYNNAMFELDKEEFNPKNPMWLPQEYLDMKRNKKKHSLSALIRFR